MKILDLANQYNKFQNNVGKGLDHKIDKDIIALFADNFKKIANGDVLVSNRDALKHQLLSIRRRAGEWFIDVKEVVALQDAEKCLIRYHLQSTNMDTFDVMAIMQMNANEFISQIDELYYQMSS